MHLSDADLGAALDPAGGGVAGIAARTHAATCDACGAALREAHAGVDETAELLELLDHGAPAIDYQALEQRMLRVERARQAEATKEYPVFSHHSRRPAWGPRLEVRARTPHSGVGHGRTVNAAARRSVVLLALGAAAAAAAVAPRSPVRALIARVATRSRSAAPTPQRPALPPAILPAAAPVTPRGVAITSAEHVDLLFRMPAPGGALRIRTTAGSSVSVMASAAGPVYTVGTSAIVVDPRGTPGVTYDVELPTPDHLHSVSIRVGDRLVFARRGVAVRSDSPPAPDGSYHIPLDS